MDIEVRQLGPDALGQYGQVPIRFTVETVFRVEEVRGAPIGLQLVEERIAEPYAKDYDAYHDEGPTRWARRFDVTGWGIFLGFEGERHVGGAIVAPASHLKDLPADMAQLFDIRVHPDLRHRGVGSRLFRHAADWARSRGHKLLKIETQNVNVPACRFYAKQGARLGAIDRHAYAGYPPCAHETRLLWYRDL
jgi:GNAT superfamily N-acetyltransferase